MLSCKREMSTPLQEWKLKKQRAIERHQLELEVEQFRAEQNFSATQLWR
jgi:hypothetical protein